MSKHSKHTRRLLHQAGMGGGFRIIRQVPVQLQRRRPPAPSLIAPAHFRLLVVEQAERSGVAEPVLTFGVPPSTIYRWRQRYDPADLTS